MPNPQNEVRQFALRFISGKYKDGIFPLHSDREFIIGRGSEVDIVLNEDMVSRKHAKMVTVGGQISIADLDSTNGTFVNGETVQKARLKEGDRILIGTSILRLVASDGTVSMVTEADARRRMEQTMAPRTTNASMRMSGIIDEIPLPDLMQLLSTSRKSGVLLVHNPDHGDGRIYFRKGQIYFATIDDSFDIGPRKAIYRMLTWTTGTFTLEPPDDKQVLEEIQDSTEGLLMEGMRLLDEMSRAEHDLPPAKGTLAVPLPLHPPLRDLNPAELDLLQLAINNGTVQAVLDKYAKSDLDALATLKTLIAREYLVLK